MKTKNLIFIIIFICGYTTAVFSQKISDTQLVGKIADVRDKSIKIGGDSIPISETGEFTFSSKIKSPILYDLSYGQLNWVVYLEPNCKTELKLDSGDLSSLEYKGKLAVPNYYLKKACLLDQSVNDFNFMMQLYLKNETGFLLTIDSLINAYQAPLSSAREENVKLSKDFIKLFKAYTSLKVYNLIVHYPDYHRQVTGEEVTLSKAGLDYINPTIADNIELLDLSCCQEFCRLWIDYITDMLAAKNTEHKDYNHKKMDAVFGYLPKLFTNHELSDYWFSEYLSEFIQSIGMANSEKYIKDFYSNSKTEVYRTRIKELCNSILEGQKDHIVKTYKSINGYNLQAHIFYPDNFKKGKKRSAIAFFHGGGWTTGNYSWVFNSAKYYSNLGMIGIAVQYRLSNNRDISPVDAMQDAKDLMIWLRINADSLGIISNKIAGSGWSAGGHLIASAAVFADTLPDKKISSVPDALLLTSPALNPGHNDWFVNLVAKTGINPFRLSPAEHVFKGLPPTIIFHGREDHVVPLQRVRLFYDKMVANGDYCDLCIYDNVGHLFTPSYLDDTQSLQPDHEIEKQADKKAVEFMKKFGFINQ